MMDQEEPLKPGMTLPVASHIDRLEALLYEMSNDLEDSEKELHMLRGAITQLSYISKKADDQLNHFLVDNMASLKNELAQSNRDFRRQLRENRDKIAAMEIQQQDIASQIQDYLQQTSKIEERVGLGLVVE